MLFLLPLAVGHTVQAGSRARELNLTSDVLQFLGCISPSGETDSAAAHAHCGENGLRRCSSVLAAG